VPSDNEPVDPVVLRQLVLNCLVELRNENEEFAYRLAHRIRDLRSQLDWGTYTAATLDRVWEATPAWLNWIQRGLTDEPAENRLVDPSRDQAAERGELPQTTQLLKYLRNHPIDLSRYRSADQRQTTR
jgi:hypothetical protein